MWHSSLNRSGARESRPKPLAVATWTVDLELRITFWDAGGLLTVRGPRASFIARPVEEALLAHGVVDVHLVEHRRALEGVASHLLLRLAEHTTLRVNISPLRGGGGTIIGAVGVALQVPTGGQASQTLLREAAFGRAVSTFLGHAVRHKLDGSLFQCLVDAALDMVPHAEAVSFWLADDSGRFRHMAAAGVDLGTVELSVMTREEFDLPEAASAGPGATVAPGGRGRRAVPLPEATRQILNVPVANHGEPVAYLRLYGLEYREAFDEGDRELVERYAEKLAQLFHHAELERTLGRKRAQVESLLEKYQALAEFSAEIETIHDTDELIEHGMQRLLERFEFDTAMFTEVEGGAVHFTRLRGAVPDALRKTLVSPQPLGAGINGWVADYGEALYVEDYPSWPSRHEPYVATGVQSMLALPIRRHGQVRHTLAFATLGRRAAIGEDGVSVANAFVRRLENAFERTQHLEELAATRDATFRSLGVALEYRDLETRGHTDRVVDLAGRFADALGLDNEQRQALVWGAYLHDLGKVAVPDAILLKPGRLTEEEFETIRQHTVYGVEMVRDIPFLPAGTRQVVRSHHERWDGHGYPDELAGERIPLLARVFSLVDVYDALTSERPYKSAWTHEAAVAELKNQAGSQFDPVLVPRFLDTISDHAANVPPTRTTPGGRTTN